MPDDKPPQPPERPTVSIEKPPAWAIALPQKDTTGFQRLEANYTLIASDLEVVKGRVGNLEEARRIEETRANANSIKVRGVSENDMSQDAKLADVLVWRAKVDESLVSLQATQTEQLTLLRRLDAVAANPMVRRVAYAIGLAILGYLASKGLVPR